MLSQRVACLWNCMNPSPTFFFVISFGRRCFLWPHLRVNCSASVSVVSNLSPHLPAHSMGFRAVIGPIGILVPHETIDDVDVDANADADAIAGDV